MTEWTELKTLQDVAAAVDRDDEIEVLFDADWEAWDTCYYASRRYRSRPKKKVKQIVLREALMRSSYGYYTRWCTKDIETPSFFIKWLDTPERIVEVDE